MSTVSVEASEGLAPEGVANPLYPTLLEKAGDLGRAAIMKDVLGPHLDAMMRPLYEAEVTKHEVLPSLEGDFPLRVMSRFFKDTQTILRNRFLTSVKNGEANEQFVDLIANREELIYYSSEPMLSIREALGTSVAVPLKVATWISGLEKPEESLCYPGYPEPVGYTLLDANSLTEIMERESFKDILMRLTRGPNEFLGEDSDEYTVDGLSRFYAFMYGDRRLRIEEAFDIQDGRVTGLSDRYAVAADQRRRVLRESDPDVHRGKPSSGCPVRHSFEDAAGRPQEPLVLTANTFVVNALKRAEQIPLELST